MWHNLNNTINAMQHSRISRLILELDLVCFEVTIQNIAVPDLIIGTNVYIAFHQNFGRVCDGVSDHRLDADDLLMDDLPVTHGPSNHPHPFP